MLPASLFSSSSKTTHVKPFDRNIFAAITLSISFLAIACKQEAPVPVVPTPAPTVIPVPTPDTKRTDAITALKAVNSVVENQGTLEQFQRYQLEAAIKVDALPDTASNTEIKAAAALYKHANALVGISRSQHVFSSQLTDLKKTYADMPEFIKTLNQMNTRLGEKEVELIGKTGLTADLLEIEIRHGRASNHLLALKAMGLLTARASDVVKALQ